MAFRGHFDYSLDAKNRLNVPPKFRAAFSGGVVLAKGLEPCIWMWPPEAFDRFTQQVLGGLNPALLEHAGIDREVVVVGVLDYLEVWARDRWLAGQDELGAEIGQIADGLGHPA